MVRHNIYYWKCDNPLTVQQKRVFNDKYRLADITPTVELIAREFFDDNSAEVEPGTGQGNHYTYIIKSGNRKLFFRADDGKTDDAYMIAEGAAMELAGRAGVCVPQVYDCDVSLSKYPIRYQIMELIGGDCLNKYYQDQTINYKTVGFQIGCLLSKLHSVKLDGFGFFDTGLILQKGVVKGIDKSNKDYFFKRLSDHLKCLRDNHFLEAHEISEIEAVIEKNSNLLELDTASMVHKDVALWNMMGSCDNVAAIIDWDDVVASDPADDISVMRCFYDDKFMANVFEGYSQIADIDDIFKAKISLYLLRNMIWKAVIRIIMNYFEMGSDFFLINKDNKESLKDFTYKKIYTAINELKRL